MMSLVFRTKFGSHLYGTNTEKSDEDFKSIRLPSAREIILGTGKETTTFKDRPTKAEKEKNLPGEYEEEQFTLRQYLKLVSEGQTVSLDMLFAPHQFIQTMPHDIWFDIQDNRHRLISKKSGAFVGYCRQQAKKYGIKGSRVAAVREVLNLLKRFDPRDKLGDYNHTMRDELQGVEHVEFTNIIQASGVSVGYLDVCGRKLQYTSRVSECIKVVQHLMDEYGSRALLAEKNEGIDWKALSHAVRIGEQAIELFNTGFVTFPRPNARFLKAIKQGLMSYKTVAEIIEENFVEVEKAADLSSLPEDVDHEWINNFIFDNYKNVVINDKSDMLWRLGKTLKGV
jgi:hypothetical protein